MIRILLVVFILILFYVPSYISEDFLSTVTEEDGFYEWLGALSFLVTSLAFIVLASRPSKLKDSQGISWKKARIYFWLLALLFFVGFGEEISWGQRVFGFETPEALKEVNEQDEFNLHNLTILHGDSRGAAREGFGRFFTAHRLFYIFFIGYLLVLPALGKTLKWFRTQIQRFGIPLAPWSIGLLFLANWFYSKGLEWVLPDFDKHGLIEIKEAGMALILLLIPLYFLGVYKDTSPLDGIRPLKK